MKYETVQLEDIPTEGPGAANFSFSFEPEIGELASSIETVGLVRPPLLRKSGKKFDVVCGLKRVLACKSLGLAEIAALVCGADELSDEKCLWHSLIDNDCPGRLSPVERAIALARFSEHGYNADKLAREVAPRLGLPSSRRYVEDCLGLLSTDGEILRAVHDGSFGAEQAFCLRQIGAAARAAVFRVLRSCKANLNETREMVSLIPDVAAMKDMPVTNYVETELATVVNDESLTPRKRFELLRDRLRRSRYPRLTEVESAFEGAVGEMKLDEGCRVSAPKHFEGNEIGVSIKADSTERLAQILGRLSSAEAGNGFQRLFSIVRGSDR
ncbi:MAG: ParB N-terminal domain-containing protein [Candidatus Abyssubacteria bacterium]|nr:ParB N-terminal domain-containing protein [Candidatus Abyssubacteria bacterium]